MKGDFTRLSFNPTKHYRGVLMQQGRVQLDSDWNEQVQIAEHRYATLFSDFVGPSGTKGNDMLVTVSSETKLSVALGHYYVDGMLVENEAPYTLDLSGKDNGFYLCYLDVWERHVTAAEDLDLREEALGGPDTATRLKTEWKVRCHPVDTPTTANPLTTAGEPFESGKWPVAENWQRPLSTGTMALEKVNLNSSGNQLYRVEVHAGSSSPKVKFKWSRDNGSAVALVEKLEGTTITLKNRSLSVLEAFRGASYIEVTSNALEADCKAGFLAKVVDLSELVDNGQMTVKWEDDVQPILANLGTEIFIRRWEGVFTPVFHATTSDFQELELGLKVNFTNEFYRPGDYWLIPVRSRIARDWITTQTPGDQLPKGINHHYAALAMVEINSHKIKAISGLRVTFNPLTSKDLSTTEDLCIGGKLGVGFSGGGHLNAPLNVRRGEYGRLVEFQSADDKSNPIWAINDISSGSALCVGPYVAPGKISSESKGLFVNKDGDVGIGTTNIKRTLHVQGSGGIHSGSVHSGGNGEGFSFGDRQTPEFVETPTSGERWVWYSDQGIAHLWSGGDKLSVNSDGKVGIGQLSPKNSLDVNGGVVIGGNYAGSQVAPTNGLSVQGNATVGGTLVVTDVTTLTGNLTANGDTNTFKNLSTTGTLKVTGLTTLTDALNANGGITTTNLTATDTLEVTGATTLTGALNANGGISTGTGGNVSVNGDVVVKGNGKICCPTPIPGTNATGVDQNAPDGTPPSAERLASTLTPDHAALLLYKNSDKNWAGIGVLTGGGFWLRSGTTYNEEGNDVTVLLLHNGISSNRSPLNPS